MTSAWRGAAATLALAQQIQKSRSGRLRCHCLWSGDLSSERALRSVPHHAAVDPDASPSPAIQAGTAFPGEALLSPHRDSCQGVKGGFSLILS